MVNIPKSWGKLHDIIYASLPFLLSGIFHSPPDFVLWYEGGIDRPIVLPFFCKTMVAIKLETIVVSWYCSYQHRLGLSGKSTWTFEHALGYMWVFIFTCYATAPAGYPLVRYLGAQNNRSVYWQVP